MKRFTIAVFIISALIDDPVACLHIIRRYPSCRKMIVMSSKS
jgi:hypothetical protein